MKKDALKEILLIENSKSQANIIKTMLERHGYNISIIGDGREALEYLLYSGKNPDVVLLDYYLPSLNGIEILNEVNEHGKNFAIIFLAVANDLKIAVEAMKAGALDFMPKSLNYLEALPEIIEKVYEIYQQKLEKIKLENALKNKEFFEDMINGFDDPVFVKDNKHHWVTLNDACCKLMRSSKKNIEGKTDQNFFLKEKADVNTEIDKLVFESGKTYEREESYTDNKGITHIVSTKKSIVRSATGEKYIVGTIKDITNSKKEELRYAKEHAEFLFQFVPSAIFTFDNECRITSWNKKAAEITGYSFEEVKGKNCSFFTDTPQFEQDSQLGIKEKKPIVGKEKKIRRKDGQERIILFNVDYIKDYNGYVTGGIESFEDITEHKKAGKELLIGKQKAEEADKLKSTFLANMSHEIRTPMNGIIGFAEILKDPSLSYEKKEEYLNLIQESGKILLDLVNDIIDISKIEANQIVTEETECSLNYFLFELYSFFLSNNSNKGISNIELRLNKGLTNENSRIYTDQMRLRQVLTNLIGNALKYTCEGYIEFGYILKDDQTLQFFVKDTGIGIQKNKLSNIFERFVQVHNSTTRQYQGTGLGLAISKGFIELMGGKIWVESEIEKGSTFYFTIPFKPVEHIDKKMIIQDQNVRQNYAWNNKTLLIVEDDNVSFRYLAEILKKTKVNILHEINGRNAVKTCKSNENIDLVLMDIQLPDINGYEATKQIKKNRKELPVIAQTAFAMTEDKDKCLAVGCNDYIAKPITSAELLSKISIYITNKLIK